MTQKELDRLTFDHYVELLDPELTQTAVARAVAHQLGCSYQTVIKRVRRHSLRIAEVS